MADYNSKVVLSDGTVLIDLTSDTVEAAYLLDGYTAHKRDGSTITGSCTYDADTSDANAISSEILLSKTAYVNGTKLTGSMPNNGAIAGNISNVNSPYTIPQGYHDGSGTVGIDSTSASLLIPGNIRSGVEILSIVGTYEGEDQPTQSKTATPTWNQQTVLPDTGYVLNSVTVNAIPIEYTENPAGGYTVTIG